ncbi:MAG: hypothetical protein L0Y66_20930 [Myxococcaceae bacterium]|nr:hypothetical protein [Myxococcaceae bacterium]MCI0672497.1 hypothetical protein [Myxococcaceae bacterium]
MRILNLFGRVIPVVLIALLGACGGSDGIRDTPLPTPPPPPAPPTTSSGLAYTDPQVPGWRLVRDPSSTATQLVLNLVGPADQKGRGVGFNLRSDGSVKFAKFSDGSYIHDLGVFKLGNKTGPVAINGETAAQDIYAVLGAVKDGGKLLTVGAYQKDRRWPAQRLDVPLYQVAIDFDPQVAGALKPGTRLPLTFVRARSIPEDIGDSPDAPKFDPYTILNKYRIDDVTIAVGTLVTQ